MDNNKQADNGSDSKAMGEIVRYLKNYPFLLITVAGLLILVGILIFDREKLEIFKWLIYAVVLVPVALQFLLEFRKQGGRRVVEEKTRVVRAGKAPDSVVQYDSVHFSRKAIASLVLVVINVLAFGDNLDADAHLGAIVMLGIPALLLGFSALNDTLHGRAMGKGWAIAATVLPVLMILASIGGMSEADKSVPEPLTPIPSTEEFVPSTEIPDVPDKQVVTPPLPARRARPEPAPDYEIASQCVTQYGPCPMMVALPVGSSCTCTGQYGVFPGIAQ